MGKVFSGYWHGRYVAWELFVSRLTESHQRSLLGMISLFFPLVATAMWATLIQHARVINSPDISDGMPYSAFVLLSLMLWMTFVESVMAPLEGILEQLRSLAHVNFPVEAVILARIVEVLFHFGVKLVLIVGVGIAFRLPVQATIVFAPFGLLFMILFGFSIGLFLAPFNVLFRDVGAALTPIMTCWLFLTPVLFPMPRDSFVATLFSLNPLTPLLGTTRELATLGTVSQPVGFAVMSVLSVLLFLLGSLFLRRAMPVLIEKTNS